MKKEGKNEKSVSMKGRKNRIKKKNSMPRHIWIANE